MSGNIDRNNFYKFTEGHFAPCPIPDREPDYHSQTSSYWYTDEGVIRQSDHWGSGIASCSWTLGEEPLAPCYRNKDLGQRSGFIPWDGFRDPERTVKVTHQFGALDYDKLGALPIESERDDFGAFDIFAIKREWFIEDATHFTFAGRTLEAPPSGPMLHIRPRRRLQGPAGASHIHRVERIPSGCQGERGEATRFECLAGKSSRKPILWPARTKPFGKSRSHRLRRSQL